RVGVYLFDLVVAIGYFCSWSDPVARLGLPTKPTMMVGAASLIYLFTATVVVSMHAILGVVKRQVAADVDSERRRLLNTAGNALVVAPLAALGYGSLVQRTDFHVREVDLPVTGLPQDLDGLRILQLSDIHLSIFLSERELERVIDAAMALRP